VVQFLGDHFFRDAVNLAADDGREWLWNAPTLRHPSVSARRGQHLTSERAPDPPQRDPLPAIQAYPEHPL